MKKRFIKWLFREILKDPVAKKEFVDVLLSDTSLGFNIFNNRLRECNVYNNTIDLKTTGNIILDEVILPKGFSIHIVQD